MLFRKHGNVNGKYIGKRLGCAMARTVSRQLHTVKTWARSHSSSYGFCGEQCGTETGLSPRTVCSILPVLHTDISLSCHVSV